MHMPSGRFTLTACSFQEQLAVLWAPTASQAVDVFVDLYSPQVGN